MLIYILFSSISKETPLSFRGRPAGPEDCSQSRAVQGGISASSAFGMMWLGTSVMDRLSLSDGGLPESLRLALWD